MSLSENEKQTKRNIRRKINDMADYIMSKYSADGEDLKMSQSNAEDVAKGMLAELFGVNTVGIDAPVDEESCKQAEDIIAMIKAKGEASRKAKDVTNAKHRNDMFGDIRKMADEVVEMSNTKLINPIDPFDDAMSIMEKK